MKTILVKKYQCDFCNKLFDNLSTCDYHEHSEHLCPKCENSYYVYGCELNYKRLNKHKNCKFKEKSQTF